ncbi:hypothetical protein FRC10_003334, partial [Ceratobasidium sp. 414]
MSSASLKDEIMDLHSKAETTKYLARKICSSLSFVRMTSLAKRFFAPDAYYAPVVVVSCTFLVYDILITTPNEIRYVWGSRWSFARMAFHFNRVWAPVMLTNLSRSQTTKTGIKRYFYTISVPSCLSILSFYIYGTIIAMLVATSELWFPRIFRELELNTIGVLITRIWAIYELKS